jgi:hypothetical protein
MEPMGTLFGRAFELPDGRIVLPCEFCGSPAWEPEKHMCPGLNAAMLEELDQRIRDGD